MMLVTDSSDEEEEQCDLTEQPSTHFHNLNN